MWAILGGLYIRLMIMIFLSLLIFAMVGSRVGRK